MRSSVPRMSRRADQGSRREPVEVPLPTIGAFLQTGARGRTTPSSTERQRSPVAQLSISSISSFSTDRLGFSRGRLLAPTSPPASLKRHGTCRWMGPLNLRHAGSARVLARWARPSLIAGAVKAVDTTALVILRRRPCGAACQWKSDPRRARIRRCHRIDLCRRIGPPSMPTAAEVAVCADPDWERSTFAHPTSARFNRTPSPYSGVINRHPAGAYNM